MNDANFSSGPPPGLGDFPSDAILRNLFSAIIENSDDAILSEDLDGIIRSWNSGASRIFGYTAAEAVGQSIAILIPEDRRSEETEFLARIRRGERVEHYESVRRRKDGRLVDVSLTLSPIRDDVGNIVAASKIARDVSDQKRANTLRLALASIVDSSSDAIISKDLSGTIRTWNLGASRLLGYTADEVIGRSILMLIPPDRHGEETMILERIRRGEVLQHFVSVRRHKDGSMVDVSVTISPMRDETGTVVGASKIVRDISAQKRFEAALQQATRMKSEFLANMSHELRTPLNGIIGFTELLVDERPGPLNPKQREFLRDILSSGQHLLQLINDVLDLAKVEAGRTELRIEAFSVRDVLDEVCATMRPAADRKRIGISVDIDPGLAEVVLDRQRFKQVLYNLLSNAVKFSADGAPVAVRAAATSPDRFTISLIDHGIGIAAEDMPRLFAEFQQLDSSTTRPHEGTGLGLALTRRLVHLLSGQIEVQSQLGVGSTFILDLPRKLEVPSSP